jgi:hypothetical protein
MSYFVALRLRLLSQQKTLEYNSHKNWFHER